MAFLSIPPVCEKVIGINWVNWVAEVISYICDMIIRKQINPKWYGHIHIVECPCVFGTQFCVQM